MIIIASDPGKTTGVAVWDDRPGRMAAPNDHFISFEMQVEEYFDWLASYVHESVVDGQEVRLVCESFLITVQTAKNTQAGWSLEMIGVNKFLAHRYHLAEVKLQSPSVAKTFGTDSKLKHVGWHTRGRGHANDAARHLMTFAATNKMIFDVETLKELAQV